MKIPVDAILPNPEQPRKNFDMAELTALADSIRVNDLINAIAVEEAGNNTYILIDGERRWRAHKMLKREHIEATVMPSKNGGHDRLIRAMVANLHRADLSPIEEGKAYKKMVDMGMSYNSIAHKMGVSLPVVMGRLKLIELEPEVQDLVEGGLLPMDVRSTNALLALGKPEDQVKMATRLARPGIRIQTIEKACSKYKQLMKIPTMKLEIPAVDIARMRRSEVQPLPKWTALQQIGRVPPWAEVKTAANETCRNCALYDFASPENCKDCPAVELIRTLLEVADERK